MISFGVGRYNCTTVVDERMSCARRCSRQSSQPKQCSKCWRSGSTHTCEIVGTASTSSSSS